LKGLLIPRVYHTRILYQSREEYVREDFNGGMTNQCLPQLEDETDFELNQLFLKIHIKHDASY